MRVCFFLLFFRPVGAAFWPSLGVMALEVPLGESRAASDAATRPKPRVPTRCNVASPRVAIVGKQKYAHSRERRKLSVQFATWNVRTLINVCVPVETAFARGTARRDVDDRKIDVVVNELR